MKYSKGDSVKLKDNLITRTIYGEKDNLSGFEFMPNMKKFCGQTMTIYSCIEIRKSHFKNGVNFNEHYTLAEDKNKYFFTEDMFEEE